MKKFCKAGIIGWLLGTCIVLCRADTAAIVETYATQGSVKKTILTWTTSTNLNSVSASTISNIRGELLRVTFIGSTAYGDYDVTLTDSYGQDVLFGFGASIPSNTVTTFKPGVPFYTSGQTNIAPVVLNDLLTVFVTNAGDNVSGQIILWTK